MFQKCAGHSSKTLALLMVVCIVILVLGARFCFFSADSAFWKYQVGGSALRIASISHEKYIYRYIQKWFLVQGFAKFWPKMPSDATREHPEIFDFFGSCPNPRRLASIRHSLPIMEKLYPQTVIFSWKICEILTQKFPQMPPQSSHRAIGGMPINPPWIASISHGKCISTKVIL